jgi:hypothetical protein
MENFEGCQLPCLPKIAPGISRSRAPAFFYKHETEPGNPLELSHEKVA